MVLPQFRSASESTRFGDEMSEDAGQPELEGSPEGDDPELSPTLGTIVISSTGCARLLRNPVPDLSAEDTGDTGNGIKLSDL